MKHNVKLILKAFIEDSPYTSSEDWRTVSLGGGLWAIEYYLNGSFVCEWVGSNGTRQPSDDLHGISTADYQRSLILFHRIKKLPKPEFLRNSANIN
jgi:hypothetical protein